MWPDVVQRTATMRRATWMILMEAQVLGVQEGTLALGIRSANHFHAFKASGHDEIVRQALIEELGLDCRVEPVLDPGASLGLAPSGRGSGDGEAPAPAAPPEPAKPAKPQDPPPAPRPARQRVGAREPEPVAAASAVPPHLDEPADDDPDDDDAALSGVALLQRDLGATVIGEYDAS